MQKLKMLALSAICATTLLGCASKPTIQYVAASCPELPPVPAQVLVKWKPLSPQQLQLDLLDDTPTSTQ